MVTNVRSPQRNVRGPIRDALKILAAEGLIDTNRRSATVVGLSGADIDELFSLREAMERLALRIALDRDRASLVAGLNRALHAMRRAAEEHDGLNTGPRSKCCCWHPMSATRTSPPQSGRTNCSPAS